MSLFTVLLALIPGFTWLFFYLQEDEHPEPKRFIFFTFLLGCASAIVAYVAEHLANVFFGMFGVIPFSLIGFIVFAFIEEISKFGAAYYAIHKNPAFDEPVDAMIYAVVAALGFATIENLGVLSGGGSEAATLGAAFETAAFRFVGATLLHTLAASIVGYYWAQDIRQFFRKRLLVKGILLATALHAVFNYLIINCEQLVGPFGFLQKVIFDHLLRNCGNLVYPLVLVTIVGFFTLADFEKLKNRSV